MVGLHDILAIVSGVLVLAVGLEAALRVWRGRAPALRTSQLGTLALLLLVVTSASGLGLFVGGARPHRLDHLMYGGFALVTLPLVGSLTTRVRPRPRAMATALGALFVLTVIARLFATG